MACRHNLRPRKEIDYREVSESFKDLSSYTSSKRLVISKKKTGKKPVESIDNGLDSTPVFSDYEKMIMEQIEQRNKFMAEMGFPDAVTDLKKCIEAKIEDKKPKPKKPCEPRPRPPPRAPSKRLQAQRRINYSEMNME